MKRIAYLFLILSFTFTCTSCSKSKEKKISVTLDEYISHYEGLQAIQEEKSALDVQADEMAPTKGEDLQEYAKVLAKLYNVYTTEMPPLIEKEKNVRAEAITKWKERYVAEIASAQETADAAFKNLEINALRDLLATKVKANEVATERFTIFQLMTRELQSQAEDLKKRAENVTPETQASLLAGQEIFNQLGAFILSEQEWLIAHPPIEQDKVIEEWRMDLPHSEIVEQALKSYQDKYE
ncbi:MAG: hypothetical protein KDK96_04995 [Chlamydiia bacterium]|nr:hypothetical protein [Chlamydiia bacterium]